MGIPDNQIPYDYTKEVKNRFKGLGLIDRMPYELWAEVPDILQETGIKNPQEKRNILGLNKWTENKTENKNKDNDNITQFDWKSQPISV